MLLPSILNRLKAMFFSRIRDLILLLNHNNESLSLQNVVSYDIKFLSILFSILHCFYKNIHFFVFFFNQKCLFPFSNSVVASLHHIWLLDNIAVDNKFLSRFWHLIYDDGNLNVKRGQLQIQSSNLAAMRIWDQYTKKSCPKCMLVLLWLDATKIVT